MADLACQLDRSQDATVGLELQDLFLLLRRHTRLLVAGPLAVGVVSVACSYLVTPVFTASTTFLPPQQQQSSMVAALASLGPLSGLAGGAGGATPGDQYVSLMQSARVSGRIIEKFDLKKAYGAEFTQDAMRELQGRVRISLGKKDGLVTLAVEDTDPVRATAMANQYVTELQLITSTLAITEAQQRRVFFEQKLKEARDRLAQAQRALQSSGISAGALRADPKTAAEAYARLQSEIAASEVRVQALRGGLADGTPEVQRELAATSALRQQLARVRVPATDESDPDYVGRYREFRYQEVLFELFARQYEVARTDESKEGALIQVIDEATTPERKTSPRRSLWGINATAAAFVALLAWLVLRARTSRGVAASGDSSP